MEDWNLLKMVDCGRGGREDEGGMENLYARCFLGGGVYSAVLVETHLKPKFTVCAEHLLTRTYILECVYREWKESNWSIKLMVRLQTLSASFYSAFVVAKLC